MTTQPRSSVFTIHSIPRGLCALFMCSLLLGSYASSAVAQPAQNPTTAVTSGEHTITTSELATMLASAIDAKRVQALGRIVDLALFAPEVDLGPTVPILTDIYKHDPKKANRLAAVSALSAIGDEAGMQEVRERFMYDPSLIVQYVSVGSLVDHYGPEAFTGDPVAKTLAKNVLSRKRRAGQLYEIQRSSPVMAEQR